MTATTTPAPIRRTVDERLNLTPAQQRQFRALNTEWELELQRRARATGDPRLYPAAERELRRALAADEARLELAFLEPQCGPDVDEQQM